MAAHTSGAVAAQLEGRSCGWTCCRFKTLRILVCFNVRAAFCRIRIAVWCLRGTAHGTVIFARRPRRTDGSEPGILQRSQTALM
jgi:hypothetical protein